MGHLVLVVKKDGTRFEVVSVVDINKVQGESVSTLRQKEKISLIINVASSSRKLKASFRMAINQRI